jgi:hypothetical protein
MYFRFHEEMCNSDPQRAYNIQWEMTEILTTGVLGGQGVFKYEDLNRWQLRVF